MNNLKDFLLVILILSINIGLIVFGIALCSPIIILIIVVFTILLLCGIINLIYNFITRKLLKTHHNCFKCKFYKLYNVASVGDRCCYKCDKLNQINDHTMNDHEYWKKCRYFKEEENKND